MSGNGSARSVVNYLHLVFGFVVCEVRVAEGVSLEVSEVTSWFVGVVICVCGR